uniref:Ribonuclease H2 subunit B-like n=1 Tax=Sinocyclocheilus grahami TaxID=75366 RepID=A0A672KSZ8_SINGR
MHKADLIRNSPGTASVYNSERKLDSSDYYVLNMDIFLPCETLFFIQRTVSTLKKSNISVGGGVKSSTFVRVKQEDATEEDYLRYAHGLISEYISEDLSKDLLKHLQLPEISSPKETEPPSKKRKLSDKPVEAGEDYTKFNSANFAQKPPKKMTAAQKSLAKVDKSGMKCLSAFFSPKVKQEKS